MSSRFFQRLFNLVFMLITRRRIIDKQNLPKQGAYILTTNHLSYFDTPLIFGIMGGENVIGWAAEKYEQHWLFGFIIRAMGGVFIQRGEVDRRALGQAIKAIKAGKVFAVAPEGTRSPKKSLQQGKTGVAFLADQTGVPILPVAITGTENMAAELKRLRRPSVSIRFGSAYYLPHIDRENRSEGLETNTDEIMCRIAAMLPESYRGVYHDHPRLKAILAADESPSSPA